MRAYLLIFAEVAFAGQSLVFTSSHDVANASVTARSTTGQWYDDACLDVIPSALTGTNFLIHDASPGQLIELVSGGAGVLLQASIQNESGATGLGNVDVTNIPSHALCYRQQRDGTAKTGSFEVYTISGTLYVPSQTWTYTSSTTLSAGVDIIGGPDPVHWAFRRICTGANLPLGSRMPTTAGGCAAGTLLAEWKLDGSLADSGPGNFTLTQNSGSPTYATTLYQNTIAVIKTLGAPSWSKVIPFRAGNPGQLDCTSSFSMADAANTVNCFWQILSGPAIPNFDHAAAQPTLSLPIFGDYNVQLVATSTADGTSSTTTAHIGAVATDANGVVVNAIPAADQIFGPMIALGKNPWGFADSSDLISVAARKAGYYDPYLNPATWFNSLAGTVSYPFSPLSTTLCSAVADGVTLTVQICNAQNLDLSTFPTILSIGGLGGEAIRVASAGGTSGTVNLTVAYDGRGYGFGQHAGIGLKAGQAWTNGTAVTQQKVTGSGTSLLSTFTPLGAGGWTGILISSAGTCSVTHNSTTITGSGTSWSNSSSSPNYAVGNAILVNGHHSGTAFTFFAYVNSVGSTTSITANRVYPNDADDESGLTCATFKPDVRNMVLHYDRCGSGAYGGCVAYAYPHDGNTYFYSQSCETALACYIYESHDPSSVHPATATCLGFSGMECGKHIAYMDSFNYVGDNGGANFYDEGLANYSLWLRSGLQLPLDAARQIEGQEGTSNPGWLFWPELGNNDIGTQPRRASILGAWASYLLDGHSSLLGGLRSFANTGIANAANFASNGGCNNDQREGLAYPQQWLAASALWDPSAVSLGYVSSLSTYYTTYAGCAGSGTALQTNSWQSGFLWNSNQTPALSATNGSAVLTGTAIPSNICGTTPQATGTAAVTSGSDVVTSSAAFVTGGGKIMFEDATLGLISFDYVFDSTSQVHISGKYPGANASLTFWIDTDSSNNGSGYDSTLVFGTSASDSQLAKQWSCRWNNSGQITLDRAWDGSNTSALYGWRGNLGGVGVAGKGSQPFIVGLKTHGDRLGSYQAGSLGTNFLAQGQNTALWLKTYGWNAISGSFYYGRLYPGCEPAVSVDSTQPQNFPYLVPQCGFNGGSTSPYYGKQISRALIAEGQNAAYMSLVADNSSGNKAFWDGVYCNQWDQAGYTTGGLGCDQLGAYSFVNNDWTGGKWRGFAFGIGMAAQWPAARLGGVLPAVSRTLYESFSLQTGEDKVVYTVTAPSGAVTIVTCTTSPCALPADARQGDLLMSYQFQTSAGVPRRSSYGPVVRKVQ